MLNDDNIKEDWKAKGYDPFMARPFDDTPKKAAYIGGAKFDAMLDDTLFNRMLRLRNLPTAPQGNDAGKIYWDSTNKKYKIWVGSTGKWADVQFTSTSTSTTTT